MLPQLGLGGSERAHGTATGMPSTAEHSWGERLEDMQVTSNSHRGDGDCQFRVSRAGHACVLGLGFTDGRQRTRAVGVTLEHSLNDSLIAGSLGVAVGRTVTARKLQVMHEAVFRLCRLCIS